jgi:hypothetical protein
MRRNTYMSVTVVSTYVAGNVDAGYTVLFLSRQNQSLNIQPFAFLTESADFYQLTYLQTVWIFRAVRTHKFITNRWHLFMSSEVLLHVSAVIYSNHSV